MAEWTAARARVARRRADGTFRTWPGGVDLKDETPKRRTGEAGNQRHIEERFREQTGLPKSAVGDVHRTKRKDGRYHAQAWWYVRTPYGWRKSPTGQVKPTAAEVRAIVAAARPSSTTGALSNPKALRPTCGDRRPCRK